MKRQSEYILYIVLFLVSALVTKLVLDSYKKEDPTKVVWVIKCENCGTVWEFDEPKILKTCSKCPVKKCLVGECLLTQWRVVKAIADSQPDNLDAKQREQMYAKYLEEHLKTCEICN